jgi:hypothetical protein
MNILISFLPWIVFWILSGRVNIEITTSVALALVVILNIHDFMTHSVKILNIGTLIFFTGITIISFTRDSSWIEAYSAPVSNGFLFLISLFTIIIRKPFTIQYARQQIDASKWNSPIFYNINIMISLAWCMSFAISGIVWYFTMHDNFMIGIVAQVVIYAIVIRFSKWYPKYIESKEGPRDK